MLGLLNPLPRQTKRPASANVASGDAGEDAWALWHDANRGHARAAERLVRRLTPQAFALAMRLVGRREDAEDAVQDAFVRLWRS